MFYLVSYDIQDDKQRSSVCNFLKDHGYHAQKSVFLIQCQEPEHAQDIYRTVVSFTQPQTDKVLMVPICGQCMEKMRMSNGTGFLFQQDVLIL